MQTRTQQKSFIRTKRSPPHQDRSSANAIEVIPESVIVKPATKNEIVKEIETERSRGERLNASGNAEEIAKKIACRIETVIVIGNVIEIGNVVAASVIVTSVTLAVTTEISDVAAIGANPMTEII